METSLLQQRQLYIFVNEFVNELFIDVVLHK